MRRLLTIAVILAGGVACAQTTNPTCPTRAVGDNSNACASTAFVNSEIPTGGGTIASVADTNYSMLSTDRKISYTSISAARTVTLVGASTVGAGTTVQLTDISGSINASRNISAAPVGSDQVNNSGVGTTIVVLNAINGTTWLQSDGVSKWTAFGGPALFGSTGQLDFTQANDPKFTLSYGSTGANTLSMNGIGNNKTTSFHVNPGPGTYPPTGTIAEYTLELTSAQAFGGSYARWSFSGIGPGPNGQVGLIGEHGAVWTGGDFVIQDGYENGPGNFTVASFMTLATTDQGTDHNIGAVLFGANPSSTRYNKIVLIQGAASPNGFTDSNTILWEGKANNGGTALAIWWRQFINAIDNSGGSIFKWQQNLNGAGFTDKMTLNDNGTLSVGLGFQIAAASPTAGHVLRGNGSRFVDGQVSCADLSGGCTYIVSGFTGTALAASGTISWCNGASLGSNACTAPLTGTLKNMYINTASAAGAGQSFTATLYTGTYNAQTASALTCTISGASATTCNDTTHSVAITAGQIYQMQMTATAGATTSTGNTFGIEVTNP